MAGPADEKTVDVAPCGQLQSEGDVRDSTKFDFKKITVYEMLSALGEKEWLMIKNLI